MLAALLLAAAAASEPVTPTVVITCLPHAGMIDALGQTFGEVPVGVGVTPEGGLVEVFTSAGRSFTIVQTRPDGTACITAFGDGFEVAPLPR